MALKNIHQWLQEYAVSHQNKVNKAIHWVCVPLIFFSITGFFYSIKIPIGAYHLSLAVFVLAGVTVYYLTLSRTLWLGMLLFSLFCLSVCYGIEQAGAPVWLVSAIIFVLAWIGQFYGHKVEGQKPSFFKDLQFLMIGPAWIMSFVYEKLGIGL